MNNSSMDPMLIAILFPVLLRFSPSNLKKKFWWKLALFALPIIAILLCKGSVGVGVLLLAIVTMGIMDKEHLIHLVPAAIIGVIAYLTFDGRLFADSYRFEMYRIVFDWFKENANYWIGTGPGTGWSLLPYIQKSKGYLPNAYFTWLHSDWLEIIFEVGLIGFLLSAKIAYDAIKRCIVNDERALAVSIISYCGAMIFNMPNRWFVSAFVGACLLRLSYGLEDWKEDDRLAKGKDP
jgi:O-antigen ligase